MIQIHSRLNHLKQNPTPLFNIAVGKGQGFDICCKGAHETEGDIRMRLVIIDYRVYGNRVLTAFEAKLRQHARQDAALEHHH